MKVNVEINKPDDRIFVNFWNYYNGDDVVCQLVDGKLMLTQMDEEGNDLPAKEISFAEFCQMVLERAETIYKN